MNKAFTLVAAAMLAASPLLDYALLYQVLAETAADAIIAGLSASAFGIIGPITAAILHVFGTLIVIFNSARLVRKGEELEHFHPEMEKLERPATGQLTPKLA